MPLAADVQLNEIIEKCPRTLTGADLYSVCSNAAMKAIRRSISQMDDLEAGKEIVSLTMDDLNEAVGCFKPSVSSGDLKKYEEMSREWASW